MNNYSESKILWDNCKYNGINISSFFEYTAEQISDKLIRNYGKSKNYSIVCGLGGNGTDGLAIAKALSKKINSHIKVFLIGRYKEINNPTGKEIFNELKNIPNIVLKQDCYAKDIEKSDVIIEALVGTGLEGNILNKRFKDVIKRISHFESEIIAIDIASPHYNADKTFSILYPKDPNAEVIELKLPSEIATFCGPGEYLALWKPNKKTHKSKNGKILYISEDDKDIKNIQECFDIYQTSLFKLYFSKIQEDIHNFEKEMDSANVILIGDYTFNYFSNSFLKSLLQDYPEKTYVFYGKSTENLSLEALKTLKNVTLVLERSKIKNLFNKSISSFTIEGSLKRICIENKINIVLVGSKILLYNEFGNFRCSYSQNLLEKNINVKIASLIACFQTKNDPWLSIRASVFSI